MKIVSRLSKYKILIAKWALWLLKIMEHLRIALSDISSCSNFSLNELRNDKREFLSTVERKAVF